MTRSQSRAGFLRVAVIAAVALAFGALPVFAHGQAQKSSSSSSTSSNGVSLTIAYQQYGGGTQYATWFKSLAKQYAKMYPGRKIVLQPIKASENQYYTKLDLMQQSKRTAPDVLVEDTFLVNSDASAGYLLPLNKYVNNWAPWNTDFYHAMQKAAESVNGTVYGVPFNTDTRGIWYDKPMLKKLGYSIPWQPKSWNDVLAVARKVKQNEPGVVPFWFYSGRPMGEASTMQGFEMLDYGTANPIYSHKTNKWIVKSPGFLDSLKFIHTIFSEHLAEPMQDALTPQSETIAAQQMMPKQKVAMLLTGEWVFNNWLPTGPHPWANWYKVYGLAKMPKQHGGGFTSLSGGWVLSISSKSQHPKAAWDFIKLACSKQNELKIDLLLGNTTPRKDVAATSKYKHFAHGYLSRSATFDAFTYFRPAYAVYPKISNDIQTAMENVMTGSSTPQQAMNTYAKQVTATVGKSHVETIQ